MQADVVFLSPPWGGVAYFQKDRAFEVTGDCFGLGPNRDLAALLRAAQRCLRAGHGCLVAYLPRHTHLHQVRCQGAWPAQPCACFAANPPPAEPGPHGRVARSRNSGCWLGCSDGCMGLSVRRCAGGCRHP